MIPQDKFFSGLDFEKVEINEQTLYKGVDNALFRIDQWDGFMAIEYADTEKEAKLGLFDDAEWYRYCHTGPEKETFKLVREDLEKHYARNPPEPF